MKLFFLIVILTASCVCASSQNWVIYDTLDIVSQGIDTSGSIDKKFTKLKTDNNRDVYVCMPGKGLFRHENNLWQPYKDVVFMFQIHSFEIYDFLFDENNELWVTTELDLHKIQNQSPTVVSYRNYNSPLAGVLPIFAIELDKEGNLWISSGSVTMFDRNITWKLFNNNYLGFPFSMVNSISCYDDEILFTSTSYGAMKHTIDTDSWQLIDKDNSPLTTDFMRTFKRDINRNYWFATWDKGLAKLSGNNWEIYNVSNSGLSSDTINDMIIASDGNIWLATNQGISVFDGNNWTVYNKSNSLLSSDTVNHLLDDLSGNIWVTTAHHVIRIENAVSSVSSYVNEANAINVFPNPASEKINIELLGENHNIHSVAISDILGRATTLKHILPNERTVSIDVSNFPQGIYHVHIVSRDRSIVKKVMVSR